MSVTEGCLLSAREGAELTITITIICFVSMFWNARTPQAYKRTKITLETPLTLYELVCI